MLGSQDSSHLLRPTRFIGGVPVRSIEVLQREPFLVFRCLKFKNKSVMIKKLFTC